MFCIMHMEYAWMNGKLITFAVAAARRCAWSINNRICENDDKYIRKKIYNAEAYLYAPDVRPGHT